MTKEKRLSAGIQKFLEDKKREDEEKAEQARRKKNELVARRDPKEQRKIDKTLKVIKSSRKFYSGDSSLDDNTSLQNEQPDEDDYGYTSTISDQFHKKLMEKYQNLPEDKKFSSSSSKHKAMSKEEIQSTKDRVKNALASKDDDHQFRNGPQQRTSKIKSEKETSTRAGASSSSTVMAIDKKPFEKPKPKLKPAPIVDFQELLKLAAQKQHEEITIEVPTKKEPERLLTSKEKREQEELEAWRKGKLKRLAERKMAAIPRVGDAQKQDRNNNESGARKPVTSTSKVPAKPQSRPEQRIPEKLKKPMPSGSGGSSSSSPSSSKLRDALKQNGATSNSSYSSHKVPNTPKAISSSTMMSRDVPTKIIANAQRQTASSSSSSMSKNLDKHRPSTSSRDSERPRDFPPKDLLRAREFPPKDLMRSREFPPKDLMRSREFPPRDLKRSKQQEISRKR